MTDLNDLGTTTKAAPDTGALNIVLETGGNKVALDLDDAPFLKEEPQPIERKLPAPKAVDADLEAQKKARKKKLIIIGSGAAALFVAIAAALWFFLLRTPPAVIEPEVIVVPSQKPVVKSQEFVVTMEPFWVELPSPQGDGLVFLVCTFGIITPKETLAQEVRQKLLTLRDGVYYYLKNKTYTFLTEPANASTVKADLASVINGYLSGGRISGVLFESYLSK